MAINMMCLNEKCKYYGKDRCQKNLEETDIIIDENGKCESFDEGKCEWYKEEKENKYI